MKRVLKSSVQFVTASLAPRLWSLRGKSLVILMYHRVLPDQHPERSTEQPGMFVSTQTFEMHLNVLMEHFTLVHLDDWLAAAKRGGALPRQACAITFDDGWRDNYEFAFPLLKAAQVPATIYLVVDLIDTHYSFWPNSLGRLLLRADPLELARLPGWLRQLLPNAPEKISNAQVDKIINRCKARADAEMLEITDCASMRGGAQSRDILNWSEILEMQAGDLVRFGSHTRRHTRLSHVSGAEVLSDELLGSRELIGARTGVAPRTFCYPNGDTSPEAVDLVRQCYLGAVTTAKGWNSRKSDPALLHRIGLHEDVSNTPERLLSRLAGVG